MAPAAFAEWTKELDAVVAEAVAASHVINAEVNPNHPTVQGMREQWHKIAALLVSKYGGTKRQVVIGVREIERLADGPELVVTIEIDDAKGIMLGLVTEAEAIALAQKHGGLPA